MKYEPKHIELGVLSLAPPFWGKPRIASILVAFLEQVQRIEDAAESLRAMRLGSNNTLAYDTIGRLLGEPRNGAENAEYLVRLRGRIIANRSLGRCGDLERLLLALFGEPVEFLELDDQILLDRAAYEIGTPSRASILDLVSDTVPSGVGVTWVSPAGEGDPLRVTVGASMLDAPHGVGWSQDPSIGGLVGWSVGAV